MSDVRFKCPHCGQHLKADEDMSGEPLDCPTCGKPMRIPGAPGMPKPREIPPPLPPPIPVQPRPPPVPSREPSRSVAVFSCPCCGTDMRTLASPGQGVRCPACGGTVIVPSPEKPSLIVVLGGGFLAVCFVLAFVLKTVGTGSGGNAPQAQEAKAEAQVSAVYRLGASDARAVYGQSDVETALKAGKIARGIRDDPEYERGFRDQWKYLDYQPYLEYQKAKGR